MKTITATEARKHIYKLIHELEINHEPVFIKNKADEAVILAKSDWNAIQETLHLLAIPGMKESIIEGLNTPPSKCKTQLKW